MTLATEHADAGMLCRVNRIRPIRGFGWRGLVLLPVAGALLWSLVAGVDLRLKLLEAITNVWGLRAMLDFTVRAITPYGIALHGTVPGPQTWLYLLPAMHLAPVRWRVWHWTAAVLIPGATPYYWWEMVKWSQGRFPQHPGLVAFGCHVVFGVVLLMLITWLTRSRRVSLWSGGTVLVGDVLVALLEWQFTLDQTWTAPLFPWLAAAWHGTLAAILLSWAIRERRAYVPAMGVCAGCGYSLEGLSAPKCPECGMAGANVDTRRGT